MSQDLEHTVTNRDVFRLQDAIREHLPLLEIEPVHHFGGGIYVRELRLPAGAVATGKMHRFENMNILVSGTLQITTDEGVKEFTGYNVFTSRPMMKKAAYAVTDVIILSIHPTQETDLEKIEQEFTVPEGQALEYST